MIDFDLFFFIWIRLYQGLIEPYINYSPKLNINKVMIMIKNPILPFQLVSDHFVTVPKINETLFRFSWIKNTGSALHLGNTVEFRLFQTLLDFTVTTQQNNEALTLLKLERNFFPWNFSYLRDKLYKVIIVFGRTFTAFH